MKKEEEMFRANTWRSLDGLKAAGRQLLFATEPAWV